MNLTATAKYTVTLADGTTRQYSRKVEAVGFATKSAQGYTVASPTGKVVAEFAPVVAKPTKARKARSAAIAGELRKGDILPSGRVIARVRKIARFDRIRYYDAEGNILAASNGGVLLER